ncbi:MAG TPA: DegV family protein [Candidatus Caenarcaniphilales bacterium]|nr:DegV family protein [Candidatus Caenarcaniphilales bacterium]
MTAVAVVTDSASDLTREQARAGTITVVPLLLRFGEKEYRAGVDITTDDFWRELTAPGAPFPKTAAAAPGTFRETFEQLLAGGAEEIVYVGVGEQLSATLQSARVAREMLDETRIHIVDSASASMGEGLLALVAADRAAAGVPGREIVAELERRREDLRLYVVLETLEYLKRGGRISGAQAAIGSVLSVKPIITIERGVVETVDKPRTRGRARARLLELLGAVKPERVAVLHAQSRDVEQFAGEVAATTGSRGVDMTIHLIGSSVGPHVGPGAYGAVILPPA